MAGDLKTTKENYLAHTAGLGNIHIVAEGHTITGYELQPGCDPADADAGLVAFPVTSLYNVLYKNGVNVDYLSILDDFVENKSVDPGSLEKRGVPADKSVAWSALANLSNENAGGQLGTNLVSALSKAQINVTVTETLGGVGIAGATVEILDLGNDISCDNCDPNYFPHNLLVAENGAVAFNLSRVPSTVTEINFVVYSVPGYSDATATTQVVASASVDIEIAMTPDYTLMVQGSGDGAGMETSGSGDISCLISDTAESGECSASIRSGTLITLTATPNDASVFTGWDGDCRGTSPTCKVTMDQAHTVTASFSSPLDVILPEVSITTPTSDTVHTVNESAMSIGGTASDNVGVTQVTWSNNRGGSGTCSGTTSWSQTGIIL